jgi:long-subunit acyl-CoA synthetase (AMP-forming)
MLSAEARNRCDDPEARRALEESLAAQMEAVNGQIESWERVAFLAIAEGPWTIENGVMTPTLKIRRNVLEERYAALIDEWHRQNRPVVWETAPGEIPPIVDAGSGSEVRA